MITKKAKHELSEIDICDLFITPALKDAGWDQLSQIRREYPLTPGPVIVRGNMSSRNKKKKKFADYLLSWKPGVPVAVVEAKKNNYSISHGMQQALGYAEILQVPSAFSSNGDAFAAHNKVPIGEEEIECEIPLNAFPAPAELWQRYKIYRNIAERVEYLGEYGQLVTESYIDYSRKQIRREYASLDDFLRTWKAAKRKDAIIKELAEYGIEFEKPAQDVGVDGDAQRISQLVWMFFLKIYDDREAELELLEDDYVSPLPEPQRWRNTHNSKPRSNSCAIN